MSRMKMVVEMFELGNSDAGIALALDKRDEHRSERNWRGRKKPTYSELKATVKELRRKWREVSDDH